MSGPALSPTGAITRAARLHWGAVVSVLLGAASLILLILTGVPAVWIGLNSLRAVNASDGRLRGRCLAVAGMILGGLGCVATMVGLFLVVFEELHVRSQRVVCLNNLRQIGGAALNYDATNNSYPPGTIANAALPPEKRLSWLSALPPFMEQKTKDARAMKGLADQLDPNQAWDAGDNASVAHALAPVYHCPANPNDDPRVTPGHTDYVGLAGVGRNAAELPRGDPSAGVFGYDRIVRPEDLKAGTTQTLLAAETSRDNGPWTAGGSPTVRGLDSEDVPYSGPGRAFGGMHPNGFNVLRADGAGDFMTDTVSPHFFETLTRVWRPVEAPAP